MPSAVESRHSRPWSVHRLPRDDGKTFLVTGGNAGIGYVQGEEHAAWPAVRAVLDPSVGGGQLWGPRVFGLRGVPVLEPVRDALADQDVAARLWEAGRELTGADPVFGLV